MTTLWQLVVLLALFRVIYIDQSCCLKVGFFINSIFFVLIMWSWMPTASFNNRINFMINVVTISREPDKQIKKIRDCFKVKITNICSFLIFEKWFLFSVTISFFNCRSIPPKLFYKKFFLKNFAKLLDKYLWYSMEI